MGTKLRRRHHRLSGVITKYFSLFSALKHNIKANINSVNKWIANKNIFSSTTVFQPGLSIFIGANIMQLFEWLVASAYYFNTYIFCAFIYLFYC